MGFRRRHLLGLEPLSPEEIIFILDTAKPCKQIFERPVKKFPTLRGKVVVNLFYEASTRTRTSFEVAGKWLSADVVNISSEASSVKKGESLADTGRTIEALGADVVVMRHPASGAAHFLAAKVGASVINAGDGRHEHPTQGLLDLFTIRERKGRIDGLTVTIVGDILHSRVARSNIIGLTKLGARVRVVGPPTLIPPGLERRGVEVYHDLERALTGADVVNVLRIQLERQKKGLFPTLREYSRLYGITRERLKAAKEDVLIMHPGPANLGVEITDEVAADPRSAIREQVTNGVAVRMALLYLITGGDARELQAAH